MAIKIPSLAVTVAAAAFLCLSSILLAQEATPPTETALKSVLEDSLVGKWFCDGDRDKVCYIAKAATDYFSINEVMVTMRLTNTGSNLVLAKRNDYATTGKIIDGGTCIVWTNGHWWAREPVDGEAKQPILERRR